MYQFLNMEGDKYSIMDHESVGILTLTKDEIWQLVVEGGAVIHGLSREELDLASMRHLYASSQCNWAEGENIFGHARSFHVEDNGGFTIVANDLPFNGVVTKDNEFVVMFEFDIGVQVPIMREDYDTMLSNDIPRIIETLKSLATPVEYDDSMMTAYKAAEKSGNLDSVKEAVKALVATGRYPFNWE